MKLHWHSRPHRDPRCFRSKIHRRQPPPRRYDGGLVESQFGRKPPLLWGWVSHLGLWGEPPFGADPKGGVSAACLTEPVLVPLSFGVGIHSVRPATAAAIPAEPERRARGKKVADLKSGTSRETMRSSTVERSLAAVTRRCGVLGGWSR